MASSNGSSPASQVSQAAVARRQRDHAIATPATLVSRLTKAASRAESRWLEARAAGKFEPFAPYLEEVVHLVRDKAALLGQALNLAPYDALVDEFSPGLTTADIDAMLESMRAQRPVFTEVERAAEDGDRVAIDYEGRIDGEVFPGGKGEGMAVTIGAHRVLPEIEQALIGMKVGGSKRIPAQFPADNEDRGGILPAPRLPLSHRT